MAIQICEYMAIHSLYLAHLREYDGKAFRNSFELKLDEVLLSTTVDAHRITAVFANCLTKWMKEAASGGTRVLVSYIICR